MNKSYGEVLKEVFGFNSFRPGQDEIIKTLLEQKSDVCGILATGVGKSLCYQFPAIYLNKTAVVVSPLISLMKDQRMALEAKEIPCCVLSSGVVNYLELMTKITNGEFRVVYTTPEHLEGNYGFLSTMIKNNVLALIAVDEAHCISQWGHDFRPSYRHLTNLRSAIVDVPILALTATATPTVIKDICQQLKLQQPLIVSTGVRRNNLSISVHGKGSSSRQPSSQSILRDLKEVLLKPNEASSESVIIYTQSRKECEQLCNILQQAGYPAQYYHAGLATNIRHQIHEDFIYDRCPIVVATIAFGMGIDKPSIRKIIIWGLPSNLDVFYQEIGRAGRDGLDSQCHLFYTPGDIGLHRFLISKMELPKVRDHHYNLLSLMRRWAENTRVCRQILLSHYFRTERLIQDQSNSTEQPCKICDNCLSNQNDLQVDREDKVDVGSEARLLIELVRSLLPMRYGFKNLIGILTGTNAKDFPDKLKNHSFTGRGSNHSQSWWKSLGELLIDSEYLAYERVGNADRSFQVVTVGSKTLSSTELWIRPNFGLRTAKAPQLPKTSTVPLNAQLLMNLKGLRRRVSGKLNLPPYLVLPDPVINQLMRMQRPTTLGALTLVDGMNQRLVQEYGEELLSVMNAGCRPMPTTSAPTPTPPASSHPKLNASQSSTLTLLKQGLTLKEIAQTRQLTGSTIENHIMKIIENTDELDPSQYLSPERQGILVSYLEAHPEDLGQLRPIKEALSNYDFSYFEIKIGLALHNKAD